MIFVARKHDKGITKHKEKSGKRIEKTVDMEKINKLEKELSVQKNLTEECLNRLKYLQADFDNYRKNFEKEKEHIINLANEALVKELLVIVDEFEHALKTMKEESDRKGVELIQKNFLKILERYGLKKIECVGKKFDPFLHEVLLKEKSDKDDGIVLEEIQKGYMLKSKVIRPSKVKVSEKIIEEKGEESTSN